MLKSAELEVLALVQNFQNFSTKSPDRIPLDALLVCLGKQAFLN